MQRIAVSGLILGLAVFASPGMTAAQDADLPVPPAAQAVLDAFEKPLHPVLGSVTPGGGVAAGLGYDTPRGQDWFHHAIAKATLSRYWQLEAESGRQTQGSRVG